MCQATRQIPQSHNNPTNGGGNSVKSLSDQIYLDLIADDIRSNELDHPNAIIEYALSVCQATIQRDELFKHAPTQRTAAGTAAGMAMATNGDILFNFST